MKKSSFLSKKKVAILITYFFMISTLPAQQVKTFLNKSDLVDNLYEIPEDDYQGRIDYLLKNINENDTLYPDMLILLSYYEIQQKNNDQAIEYCNQGINSDAFSIKNTLFNNKASAFLAEKKYDEALRTIKEGLKEYPQSAKLHYVNGLIYEAKEDFKEAVNWYQKAIRLSPYNASYHYKLGEVMYYADLVSQSALCFNMYLILNPDGEGSLSVLSALNTMLTTKNEEKKFDKKKLENYQTFSELDVLVKNYVALNNKYKVPSKIDLPYVKQSHLILSSLKDIKKENDFWGNYYIPFFEHIMKNDLFEDYSYTISYSINSESKYKPIVIKNEQNIIKFIDNVFTKWGEIISEEAVSKNEVKKMLYDNREISGIGIVKKGTLNGKWKTYFPNGRLSAEGEVNPSNNREGDWIFYHENGNISEEANYIDGKLNKVYKAYHSNGQLLKVFNYESGTLVGEYQQYNKKGALLEKGEYNKDGELITQSFYYNLGESFLNYNVPFKNNKIDGLVEVLYEDGKTKSIINFSEGLRSGEEKEFYKTGEKKYIFSNLNNQPEGEYFSFYENGNTESKGAYKEGVMIGNWQYYNYYGEKTEEVFYDEKGKKTGLYKQYDIDGIVYSEVDYKNGDPVAYRFFNKKGETIKDVKKSKGSFEYEGFYADGVVSTKGIYKTDMGKDGRWEYFTQNGVLKSVEHFKDGKLHGEEINYYPNGEISDKWIYKNDSLSGYYASYFLNGNIYAQGWYEQKNRVGEWNYYFSDTTKSKIFYYIDGKLHGKQKYFDGNNKIYSIETYHLGDLIKTEYFDTTQALYETIYEDSIYGNKEVIVHFSNGNPSKKYDCVNGILHGNFLSYYPDKTLNVEGHFINGNRENKWTWYHPNGKISSKGTYYQGQRHGAWEYYSFEGNLTQRRNYLYGELEGEQVYYNDEGDVTQKDNYRLGNQHGEKIFYDNNNNLQLIRYYNNGKLTGYSYLGKDGKLVPEIKLTNETGEIVGYYQNGKVSRKMTYNKGSFVGNYEEYYQNGQVKEIEKYENTERQGEVITYYEDGKIKEKKNYHLGEFHGAYEEYYPNGKLKLRANYIDGEIYGWYMHFNDAGELTHKNYYIADTLYY